MTPKEAIKLAKDKDIKIVDLKLCDILGTWQHFAIPVSELKEEIFTEGLGFDGSSIRGWKAINSSDMLVFPDAATAFVDPFAANPTLSLILRRLRPADQGALRRAIPRTIAKKAEAYLKSTGIADTAYFGPEAEFFIFDERELRLHAPTRPTTGSIRSRASGTGAGEGGERTPTSATRSATRRATSRSRRPTS